jgi:two-component system, OmpR family, copper resistance phosphate regulon response regulator CusR
VALSVLLVEDELKVAKALQAGFESEDYRTMLARSGEEAFFLASERQFDIIVLDLMLPGCSGLDVLRMLRQRGCHTPVVALTARDTVEDRVAGLDAGADDYLVKPFAFSELLARVRALLRRSRSAETLRLVLADLEVNLVTRRVVRHDQPIEVTVREFELLEYLVRQQGHLVSREMLARDVWRETSRATPLDNVIDVHIARLRKKIDPPGHAKLIHTVRGVGFVAREGEP